MLPLSAVVALFPFALQLLPVVLVRRDFEDHALSKDGYWLEALVPSYVLATGMTIGSDSVSADRLSRPGHKPSHQC